MNFFLTITFLFLATFCVAEKKSYEGYKLVALTVYENTVFEKVNSFEDYDPEYDVWGVRKNQDVYSLTVMLSPRVIQKYFNIFKSLNVDFEIVNHNVQTLLDEEAKSMAKTEKTDKIEFEYARYNDIVNFVLDTADANPGLVSSYYAGGSRTTVEGRKLIVIKFKTVTATRGIWLDCGIHAREWVTPATCVYVINQILREYKAGDSETVALLNKYEIHIMPVVNPDGYEYAHTTDRLWRKNRNPKASLLCTGIDLNRNCDFKWNQGGTGGPCTATYPGDKGNSESETQALQAALQENAGRWDAYYSVHCYGNYWLLPWGHDPKEIAPNYDELLANGKIGAAAIYSLYNQTYDVGSSSQLLYVTTGSTADWAYAVMNIPFSATLELRPGNGTNDATNYGFQYPVDRMPEVAKETWLGLKASMVDVSKRRP